eukprot:s680_g14.t1
MINHSVLLTGFAALALGQRGAQATCIACDPSEENVLLQRSHASEDGAALGAGAERWRVHGYPKWNCEADVHAAQQDWKDAILDISAAYRENTTSSDFVTIATEAIQALYGYDIGPVTFKPTLAVDQPFRPTAQGADFVTIATEAIQALYGYDIGPVTFKPTLAVDQPFRPTAQGALSYFVGNDATNDYAGGGGIPEDSGFAIAGGDTWSKVLFFNDQISCVGDVALAQGYYYFTNAASKQDVGVEYTFVYKKIEEGQLKIIATKEQGGFPEDSGFAIKGGETWSNVTFENNLTNCLGDVALSQGYYYFTAADSGNITGVEYSFVYKQMKTGELKIIAHHSSLPADQV